MPPPFRPPQPRTPQTEKGRCPSCGAPTPPKAQVCSMCHARVDVVPAPRAAAPSGVRLPQRENMGFGRALLSTMAETLERVNRDTVRSVLLDEDYDVLDGYMAHRQDAKAREAAFAAAAMAQAQAQAAVPYSEQPDDGPWTCPRTGLELQTRSVAGIHMHVSPACGGLMVERASMARLRDNPELWPEVTAISDALSSQATLQIDGRAMTYLTCPRCGGPMARRAFERVSGVVVDECPRDGIWFDAGELTDALRFLSRGGEVKRLEFEQRERAHLQEQRRRMPRVPDRSGPYDIF